MATEPTCQVSEAGSGATQKPMKKTKLGKEPLTNKKEVSENTPLSGYVIVFTGTLLRPRAEATSRLAQAAGATVTGSVSGKTTHLVAGPGAGSKVAEATAKGVVIWTEEEFFSAAKGGSS